MTTTEITTSHLHEVLSSSSLNRALRELFDVHPGTGHPIRLTEGQALGVLAAHALVSDHPQPGPGVRSYADERALASEIAERHDRGERFTFVVRHAAGFDLVGPPDAYRVCVDRAMSLPACSVLRIATMLRRLRDAL